MQASSLGLTQPTAFNTNTEIKTALENTETHLIHGPTSGPLSKGMETRILKTEQ